MDFGKLFQSAENAVYEVMVWVLLLPKTLFLSMFRPQRAMDYINEEWEKKADERFDEYLSPVLLWMMVAVIPLSLFVILVNDPSAPTLADATKKVSDKMIPMTLYAMIVPFTYIAWMEVVNKRPVKKSTLKISFYRHCYALAPSQILTAICLVIGIVAWPLLIIAIFLIPFYESYVFKNELNISFKKAFLYTMFPQIVLAIILVIAIIWL